MLRSVFAILVGFVAIAALAFGTGAALAAAGVVPPPGQPLTDPGLLLMNMAYVAVFAIAGCWLAAYLAPNRPMLHALILGALGFVFNVFGAIASRG